ncbi:MAG TPA: prolyl oligopeptidase family serine peptidase [Acidimicrobiales bacterium]|nr:prolyl oligopeptidase family serine peptidase [Acidimicrobiales bacterium]
MPYPPARRLDLVDDLHGRKVPDPYRWLEDPESPETMAWAEEQDVLARCHLESLPGRDRLRSRLHELLSAGSVGAPVMRGDRAFFTRRRPGQEHPVLLVREADGSERVLLDPSGLSEDDSATLDGWAVSNEGDRLAYLLSEGGDEESSFFVMDVATGDDVEGPVDRTRYSDIAWLPGGQELFYVRRLPPAEVPPGEEQYHRRVYRHRVGTDAETADLAVFGEGRDKTEYYSVTVSRDGRWLLIGASQGTAPRNDVYLSDLAGDGALNAVQEGVDVWTDARIRDGVLFLLTDGDAPRGRIAIADPQHPREWRDLVAESEAVIESYALTDDALVVATASHAVGHVHVHDRATGAWRAEVPLPGLGTVAGLSSRPEGGDDVWLGYTDFVTPPQVHRADVKSGKVELWEEAPGRVVIAGVTARQVVYPSRDGTEVRMFVITGDVAGAGRDDSGETPTILYGYGGFGVFLTPSYSAGILGWVERGGTYVIANLRGGGEEGEAWHRAGMRGAKQNVFDDFIAAAEFLVATGATSADHLGISGGSNGGLLVGAALTQRPDLFAAVVCSAPLLDMVRYERFGLGATWNDEYGTAGEPDELDWLLGYSPYHRVVEGTRYPSVLFTVFDSDTRVDPLHARKLCAALQWATTAPLEERPVLYRREQKAGHGSRSVTRTVELAVDTGAFMAERLGLELPAAAATG